MIYHLLLGLALTSCLVGGQSNDDICESGVISNDFGCRIERKPTYLIIAPKKVRPSQVIQIFTSILRLEIGYTHLNVRISIVKENVAYTETILKFDRPSSRIMQLQMPSNAPPGSYRLRIEGSLNGGLSGNVFENETDILFDRKKASCFIQLSKPIYRQGQIVHFRVIPVQPNRMPQYGSMTIYALDPTGLPVRRWLGVQTNAGGFVSQSFELADQPSYGRWRIKVDGFGYEYYKEFYVEEFWEQRFDVNVTVKPYFMNDVDAIRGRVLANQTSGKPVTGNATVLMTIIPPNVNRSSYEYRNLPQMKFDFLYFKGKIDFTVPINDILQKLNTNDRRRLIDYEFDFNVSVSDFMLWMNNTGYASCMMLKSELKLQWIGPNVRTFQPESVFSVSVAVVKYDGTRVDTTKSIVVIPTQRFSGSSNAGRAVTQERTIDPKTGVATFMFDMGPEIEYMGLEAYLSDNSGDRISMKASRYKSPSDSYINVVTSTKFPKINQYMIFHVKTSHYVPKFYYQIVASGNIIMGDELEMISHQKTFAVALSREMIPQARIVVYYVRYPEEIVVDTLNFFVDGVRQNDVKVGINRGKDFSRGTIEINTYADKGSYAAFSAIPFDMYIRGMTDGISENTLYDELVSYDAPAKGSYRHLWRIGESEYEYTFYSASGYGIDANSTFESAGLLVLSDVTLFEVPHNCKLEEDQYPCYDGVTCYTKAQECDGIFNCATDGADERNCEQEDLIAKTRNSTDRVSRFMRFYDDSHWAWKEYFVKPDGRVDFRMSVPKYPLSWIINALAISRENGLAIMSKPIKYDATRYMYIQVEAPEVTFSGETIGVRVTVFNYWYNDDFIEVLLTMHAGYDYRFVLVQDMGVVSAYAPNTHQKDHQTIVFLEPGESKDIYMPIVPIIKQGTFNFTVSASCFLDRDTVVRKVTVKPDGVLNYYFTPYLIDLITYASELIPDFDVIVPEQFVVPEVRQHLYVPESPTAKLSLFGDVVTPGFFEPILTAENILYRPYGGAEMNMFNFAYTLLTLKFKKASQQLEDEVLRDKLSQLNTMFQRQMSYVNENGSVSMFRDFERPSVWLTAFTAKVLQEAKFGEWERDLYISSDVINKMVLYVCQQQNESGAWHPDQEEVYDRKMSSAANSHGERLYNDPIPLTAYILIALYAMVDVSGDAVACRDTAKARAATYLSEHADSIQETFPLAISAYALSLTSEKSRNVFDRLWTMKKEGGENIYFADTEIPPNPSQIINTIRYLLPRQELMNDAYGTQSTAYALMAHKTHYGTTNDDHTKKRERDSMMRWLVFMHNSVGGMASTQDTIAAMEALYAFTQVDPNRNVFDVMMKLQSTSAPGWTDTFFMNIRNYTNLRSASLPKGKVFGEIKVSGTGAGRTLMMLTTTMNVEYPWLIKTPQLLPDDKENAYKFFDLWVHNLTFHGKNASVMEMETCMNWAFIEKSKTTGLAVLEIDIPTGYIITNNTLRSYAQSEVVRNLRRAEFYNGKVVYYFNYLDATMTCVKFRADRWYPIANGTIQHKMRVYDYYEPGMHNTTMYTTYNLFTLNICFACGSYQCPYCPYFNAAAVIKATFTGITLLLGFLLQRFILRDSHGYT